MSVMETSGSDKARQVPVPPFAGRVLLVDDRLDDVGLLAIMLAPLEACIVIAGSAAEALGIMDKQVVDLVVTDLNMPGLSGLDLAREVGTRHDVPAVIFMTGSQRPGDKIAALELGAVAYLQKPVDVVQLIGLAREILRSRSAQRKSDALDNEKKSGLH